MKGDKKMRANFGNNTVFNRARDLTTDDVYERSSAQGVSIKTLILIGITLISALIGIYIIGPIGVMSIYIPIIIVDFVILLIMSFNPRSAKVLSIPYAILEGLMVGAIAGLLEIALPGYGLSIAGTAFIMTIIIFLSASLLYLKGVIRVTNRFRKFMFTALLGLLLSGIILGIMSIFSPAVAYTFSQGPVAFIVAIVYVVIASLYVVISLDNAYAIVDSGLEKTYEWYAAFGILINIIWLYYEVLRLIIIILANRND